MFSKKFIPALLKTLGSEYVYKFTHMNTSSHNKVTLLEEGNMDYEI